MSYKGHRFEKWMTHEEWALFETNYKNYIGEPGALTFSFEKYLEKFNKEKERNFYELIASGFDWYNNIEEDEDFWPDIADRIEPLNEEELHG